jgi:PAS domain S-box-containing protein
MSAWLPQRREPAGRFGPQARLLTAEIAITLSGALLSAVLVACCAFGLWMLRQDYLANEQDDLRRLALTLSEQTARAFQEIDLILRETRPLLTAELLSARDDSLHRLLRNRLFGLPQGQALMVFGGDGGMRGHSRLYPVPDIVVSDRDYFQAQMAGDDGLFIAAPLRNRVNNGWMISLSRRLNGEDGAFAGVIMAALEMDYFFGLYRSLNLPPETRIELYRGDGVLLAAYPFEEARLGRAAPRDEAAPEALVAAHDVPSLPLTVRLTTPQAAVLRHWRKLAWIIGAGVLAAAAGIAALTARLRFLARQVKERERLQRQTDAALRAGREELSANQDKLRLAMDMAGMAFWELDYQTMTYFFDDRFLALLGTSREREGGSSMPFATYFREFMPPGEAETIMEAVARNRDNPDRAHYEHRIRRRDGAIEHVSVTSCPVLDAAGRPFRRFGANRIITERKQAEEAVRASEAKYRSILENAPIGIFQATPEGRYLQANAELARILGYASPEELCRSVADIGAQVFADPEQYGAVWSILAGQGRLDDFEAKNKRPDGSQVWTSLSCRAIRDEAGKILSCDAFQVDISERKALEALREDVNRIMRHDLRSPLIGIVNLPKLLLKADNLTPKQREILDMISGSGFRMLNMINMSMVLHKMESGSYKSVPVQLDIVKLITLAFEEMHSLHEGKQLSLQVFLGDRPAEADDVFLVNGEELLCFSMLENLLKNAFEASPDREAVRVRLEAGDGVDRLAISNKGAVPEAIRERFFDKYVTAGKRSGTGLGTYSARLTAAALGGDIALDASVEGETTVIVRLPRPRAAQAPALSVLVAAASPTVQAFLAHCLQEAGHGVALAQNGLEALAKLAEKRFDLVLMDMEMPECSGLETARAIRGSATGAFSPDIPIIAIAARDARADRDAFFAAGVDDFLSNPEDAAALLQAIERVAARTATSRASAH